MFLSDEQRMIRDTARDFAREKLAPNAALWAREATVPHDALRAMGELGLMGMLAPEECGGAGCGHVAYALAAADAP